MKSAWFDDPLIVPLATALITFASLKRQVAKNKRWLWWNFLQSYNLFLLWRICKCAGVQREAMSILIKVQNVNHWPPMILFAIFKIILLTVIFINYGEFSSIVVDRQGEVNFPFISNPNHAAPPQPSGLERLLIKYLILWLKILQPAAVVRNNFFFLVAKNENIWVTEWVMDEKTIMM